MLDSRSYCCEELISIAMKRSMFRLCLFFLLFWILGLYFISTSLYFIGQHERIRTNFGMDIMKGINRGPRTISDKDVGDKNIDYQIWREVRESNVSIYTYPQTDGQDWRKQTCPFIPMTSSKIRLHNLTYFGKNVTLFTWNPLQNNRDMSGVLIGSSYHHKYIKEIGNRIYKMDPGGLLVDLGAGLGEFSIAASLRGLNTISVGYFNKDAILLCSTLNKAKESLSEKVMLFTLGSNSSDYSVPDMRLSTLMTSSVARRMFDTKPIFIRINSDIDLYQFLLDSRSVNMNLIALICKWSIADDDDVPKTYRFLRSRNFVPFYMDVFHSHMIRLDGGSLSEWPSDVIWIKLEKLKNIL